MFSITNTVRLPRHFVNEIIKHRLNLSTKVTVDPIEKRLPKIAPSYPPGPQHPSRLPNKIVGLKFSKGCSTATLTEMMKNEKFLRLINELVNRLINNRPHDKYTHSSITKKTHLGIATFATLASYSLLEKARAEASPPPLPIDPVAALMQSDEWMTEEELDCKFGTAFQNLDISVIAQACYHLQEAYIKDGNSKAGYYLLWLIKNSADCSFAMPKKEGFKFHTVADTLSQPFRMNHPINYIEILCYQAKGSKKFLYNEIFIIDFDISFVIYQLTHIPISEWPNKAKMISNLINIQRPEYQLYIANALATSTDPATAAIGYHLSALLNPSDFKQAIPHIDALIKMSVTFADHRFLFIRLKDEPIDTSPIKVIAIRELIETLPLEDKLTVATVAAASKDLTTVRIGELLLAALTSLSLKEALPHLDALAEMSLRFEHNPFRINFGCAFVKFYSDQIHENLSSCVKELNFKNSKTVFVFGSVMVGIYDPGTCTKDKPFPPHLLAYDMITEKIIWGIPLTSTPPDDPSLYFKGSSMLFNGSHSILFREEKKTVDYKVNKVGEFLSVSFENEKNVRIINPKTGELEFTFQLPEKAKIDPFHHISQEGFVYQIKSESSGEGRTLTAGTIAAKEWHPLFKITTPLDGKFISLSTHCGFIGTNFTDLALFGPTGEHVIIQNCMSAKAFGNKLYTIERDCEQKDYCLLAIRTLKIEGGVVSDAEKKIIIYNKKAFVAGICETGEVILISGSDSPIFVDLNSKKVTYSEQKLSAYSTYAIDTQSGEFWGWGRELGDHIWKITAAGATLMGSMSYHRGINFLYAKEGKLYFNT